MIGKQGTPSTGTSTGNLIDNARSLIDDVFLEEWEKRLKLDSPHHLFRRDVLMAVESHLCVPPGGLASLSRKALAQDKEYWREMEACLSRLLKLLPHERFEEHPQARLMRIQLIGNAPEAEQPRRIRELFEQRTVLENWRVKANAQAKELETVPRISPNDKLGAARILVSLLAGVFSERAGRDPRQHIRVNALKDKYSGDFFDFADAILERVGCLQKNYPRGKMIRQQLRTFCKGKK